MDMKQSMQVLVSSITNEWYTPPSIINIARGFMGSIDLDPASNIYANEFVKAADYRSTDGMKTPPYGNVWLNMPYGKTGTEYNQRIWSSWMYESFDSYEKGVVLTKASFGYKWYTAMLKWRFPVCITHERLSFANGAVVKYLYDYEGYRGTHLYDEAIRRQSNDEKLMATLIPSEKDKHTVSGISKAASSLWCFADVGMWSRFAVMFGEIGTIIMP